MTRMDSQLEKTDCGGCLRRKVEQNGYHRFGCQLTKAQGCSGGGRGGRPKEEVAMETIGALVD
jgi:hypothetical protein